MEEKIKQLENKLVEVQARQKEKIIVAVIRAVTMTISINAIIISLISILKK